MLFRLFYILSLRIVTLERVFQSLRVVLDKEDAALEDIVEAFGKEEGGYWVLGGDKLKDQEFEPLCGVKGMSLSFILAVISNH